MNDFSPVIIKFVTHHRQHAKLILNGQRQNYKNHGCVLVARDSFVLE